MSQRSKRLTPKGRFWNKHIQRWQKTHMTQIQYCKKHDLSIAAFRWWRRRLLETTPAQENPRVQPVSSVTRFAEVPVSMTRPPASKPYDYEIVLPNQIQVRLSHDCDPEVVSKLLSVLETAC